MSKLTILVAGAGGREHALAWALARSPQVGQLYVAPGNAGTEWAAGPDAAASTNLPIDAGDIPALLAFAGANGVDLTVVGPEAPLAAGIVDAFQAAGQPIFGPTQAAAQLEASKAYAKAFMREQAIPTADYAVFTDYEAARRYLAGPAAGWPAGVVVKASGLAAGKGVIVCDTVAAAEAALAEIMVDQAFGAAGATVVIEERLQGPELSVLALSDGRSVTPLPPARDHKRVGDGDTGPNTGGMGAYAPPADIPPALVDDVVRTVLQPTVDGMAARGAPYRGLLYAGLMLTAAGPKVLEFNCRFGDPETQAILPLIRSDLAELLLACVHGRLDAVDLQLHPGAAATIVMAAPGYPGPYPRGRPIGGLDAAAALDDVLVFHAGTARRDGQVVTAGGRVLAVSARGDDLPDALSRAYAGVAQIQFDGAHFRRDIGW